MKTQSGHFRVDMTFFLPVFVLYPAGQLLIGTYAPEDGLWNFDAPADIDFLYYAGIIQQMQHSFAPQNPAFGGEPLSQSFIQHYPMVLISYWTDKFVAMRVCNLIFLMALALLLQRYFSAGWAGIIYFDETRTNISGNRCFSTIFRI